MKNWIVILTALLLISGCTPYYGPSGKQKANVVKKDNSKIQQNYANVPPPPKKHIELKEVEDENFSSDYMYPETDKKKSKKVEESANTAETVVASPTAAMSNAECISMIGQEKFDKYAQMLGSEAGALKKCAMLKAL